jgi:hypothetical protein
MEQFLLQPIDSGCETFEKCCFTKVSLFLNGISKKCLRLFGHKGEKNHEKKIERCISNAAGVSRYRDMLGKPGNERGKFRG